MLLPCDVRPSQHHALGLDLFIMCLAVSERTYQYVIRIVFNSYVSKRPARITYWGHGLGRGHGHGRAALLSVLDYVSKFQARTAYRVRSWVRIDPRIAGCPIQNERIVYVSVRSVLRIAHRDI